MLHAPDHPYFQTVTSTSPGGSADEPIYTPLRVPMLTITGVSVLAFFGALALALLLALVLGASLVF